MLRAALPDVSGAFSNLVLGGLTRLGIRSTDDGSEGTPLSSRIYRRFSSTFGAKLPYIIYGSVLLLLFSLAVYSSSDDLIIAAKSASTQVEHNSSLRGTSPDRDITGASKVPPAVSNTESRHPATDNPAQFYVSMFLSFLTWIIIMQVFRCLRRAALSQYEQSPVPRLGGSSEMIMQLLQMRRGGVGGGAAGSVGVANRLRMALLNRDFNGDDYEMLQSLDQDVSPRARRGATQGEIDASLSFHTVSAVEAADHETQAGGPLSCNICLGPYEARDEVRMLPCMHKYHKQCIDTWLRERATCPVCKHAALSHLPHA